MILYSYKSFCAGLNSLVGLCSVVLSVLAYSALEEVSLLSGLRGRDRQLPLRCSRLAEPQSLSECRLSSRLGTERHLANSTLSFGLPNDKKRNNFSFYFYNIIQI